VTRATGRFVGGTAVVPAASFAVFAALPAFAADGGAHGADLLWQALNLAILVVALVYFARKPLQRFFADRRSHIKADLDSAGALLDEAEARYTQWQRKLIELDRETERIRDEGRRRAAEEAETIISEAQAAAGRIQRDAGAAVEQELRRAQAALRAEAVVLATEMAERILRERMGDSDRERLLDEFITGVETRANG
jgi:F-type H+-transporting ATPase subunit b